MEERIASEQRWSTLLRRTLISGLVFTANYALSRTGLSPVKGILSGINALTASPVQSQGVVEIVNALPNFFM
jgi:hypothetical protein